MAITTDDFNKIWASASPLTPYSFSDSQYKEGWNFIGSTPPSRQMWDFLQKNNDEKMQYLLNNFDNYLPLSGGTVTGGLTVERTITGNLAGNADTATNATNDANGNPIAGTYLPLAGGTMTGNTLITMGNGESYVRSWGNGLFLGGTYRENASRLVLFTNSSANGFQLDAGDGTTFKRMDGKPDGTLTWAGNNILTAANYNSYALPLSGGTLTGVVNGVTPTAGDNSTKIATTAFVTATAQKAAAGYYNSVAEMRKSETAIVGRPCMTVGYYRPNDGGGAIYIIRSKKESDVDDGGSILVLDNGNVAELIVDGPINVKQFGARADNSTACDIPFKNALAFASKVGVQLVINEGTYILTQTLCIPTGAKIIGSTSNRSFSGFPSPLLVFKFATDSMDPAIRIDSHSSTSWDTSLPGDISGVQLSNLTIRGDNVICGLQLRCYECVFTNLTFMGFCIGIWMSNSYLNDFNHINLFNTQMGVIADAGTNSNTTIRNCWTYWDKDKNNANVDSRIAKINANYPKTSVGFMAMNEGGLRLYDCYAEKVNIGVYVHKSTIFIKHIGLELIGRTGACFKLRTDTINKGKIVADSITEWGNYCPEVNAAYGTICDLKFDMPKSKITTTDNIIDNGAYVVIDYPDVPGYILPIKFKEGGALTNPSISNNRSRFTRHSTMILDFVLTHDGYDGHKLIELTGLNSNIKVAFNQKFDIRGEQYWIANNGEALYINNPDTNWSKNITSGSRIYVEVPLNTTDGCIYYS